MSNVIDHDNFSEVMEKLFNETNNYLKIVKGFGENKINFSEIKIGGTGISCNEGHLIHLSFAEPQTLSVYKDIDERTYKILRIDEEDVETELVATANISDDPATKVFVGKSASEKYQILKSIDEASSKISKESLRELDIKEKFKNKNKSKIKQSRS